jgi:hypothetical protein
LLNWTQKQVNTFMKVHALPFHKLAPRDPVYPKPESDQEIPFYNY